MAQTNLFQIRGAPVLVHRERQTTKCPCRTPEGFRDPEWHRDNPTAVVCNASGFLPSPQELSVKAFVQPAFGGRRAMQSLSEMFGEIQTDDHIGIFPYTWGATNLDFTDWSHNGDEWIEYRNMKLQVIAWSLIPDPADSSQPHHWEVALRRIKD